MIAQLNPLKADLQSLGFIPRTPTPNVVDDDVAAMDPEQMRRETMNLRV